MISRTGAIFVLDPMREPIDFRIIMKIQGDKVPHHSQLVNCRNVAIGPEVRRIVRRLAKKSMEVSSTTVEPTRQMSTDNRKYSKELANGHLALDDGKFRHRARRDVTSTSQSNAFANMEATVVTRGDITSMHGNFRSFKPGGKLIVQTSIAGVE